MSRRELVVGDSASLVAFTISYTECAARTIAAKAAIAMNAMRPSAKSQSHLMVAPRLRSTSALPMVRWRRRRCPSR